MKRFFIFSLINIFIIVSTLFGFFYGVTLKTALSQTQIQLPRAGGSYIDPATNHRVFRLTDRTMCPAGAEHVYSDTFEHSRYGTLVACRTDTTNLNIYHYKLIGPDHSTILFNNVTAAANAPRPSHDFDSLQWIPNQKRILGLVRADNKVYEIDPWNGVTTTYAQMPFGCVFDWRVNPQGMVVARTNDKNTMCIYDPATGTSATKNVGAIASQPDQTSALFNGRGLFTWNVGPQKAWLPGFTNEITFDDFHGHLGQFQDMNGKWYTTNTKEDRLTNGGVGQIGCSNVSPWRPEQAIYNADTGQRVLIWGCDILNTDADHWTTAAAVNRFGSSGHQEIAVYDVNWNTGKVTRTPVAKVHRDPGTGYTGSPRATADYELNEILFHSGMCDGTVLEYDGTVKSCSGGVQQNLDLYVVQVGNTPTPPPSGDTTPPTISLTAPSSGSTVSGLITISANASDNNGVAGVQFLLNGNNLNAEDTSAPYSVFWDSTTFANGTYMLSARARDFAGNQTTSGSISVTVSNVAVVTPPDGTLLLYTTLDNANSITSPQIGSGSGASLSGNPTFVAGQAGSAININANQQYARLQQIAGSTQNVELTKGTVEFLYKPNYNHNDGLRHNIMSVGSFGSPGSISLVKGSGNDLGIISFDSAGTGRFNANILSNNYSWTSGQWIKIRFTWDFTVASGVPNVFIYINDVGAPAYETRTSGSFSIPTESSSQHIYIGNRSATDGDHANGVLDELRIWAGAIAPGAPPPPPPPPPSSDTTAPSVSISSPSSGSTVSGTVNVSANASDNIGVVGVQFKLNGANLGAEDTVAPYAISWDTTSASNGTHVITAVARDAAGNQTTSGGLNVTVSNVVQDTTPPIISNVAATNILTNAATIVWSTNESADTQVEYGTTTNLGQSSVLDATPLTSHVVTISGLNSGTTYYYRVKSKDTAGNLSTSALFNFTTQSSQPPTLSVILTGTPITGTVPLITSLTADVSGSATGPINYTFYCNRSDTGTNITSGYDYKFDGTNEDPKVVPSACTYSTPGTYTAKVIAERSTATSAEARITISVSSPTDTTPPTVSITSPLAGQSVSSVITVSASASDNIGIAGVQFLLNGGLLGVEDLTPPYSVSWDTTQTANGTHILSARARDNSANQSISSGVNVNVSNVSVPPLPPPPPGDTTAPNVSITNPSNGSTVSGTVNVSANASDNIGVVGVQFKLNGANLGAEDTVAPYAISWDTTSASNGTHVITAVARDAAGNQTISSSITVTVNNITIPPPPPPPGDTSAPILSGIAVTNITTKSVDISWTTNEPADSFVYYGPSTSLNATQSISTLTTTHTIKLSGLSRNNIYSYQVSSADASGNRTQSNILTFTTLSKPPKVKDGKGRNGSVILSWINPGYVHHAKTIIARGTNSYPQEPLNASQIIATINNSIATEFTDATAINGTTYYYSIFVVDADGVYSDPEFVMFTPSAVATNVPPPPPPPQGLGGNISTTPSITPPISVPGISPRVITEKILNRDLSLGSRHEEVLLLQKSLQVLGYFPKNETPTNYYGPLTVRAVLGFQASQGLPSTGVLDGTTRNVINGLSQSTLKSIAQQIAVEVKAINRVVSIGSRHEEVKILQSILKNLGFFPESEPITEYFGPITQRSLRRFQEANSIAPADGTLRTNSQDLLNRLVSLNPDLAKSPETVTIPQVSPILNTSSAQQEISTVATEFTKVLREGITDSQVRLLQQVLRDEGVYPEGIISGYFGPLTRRALERFQEKYGIVSFGNPDTTGYGAVGPATQAKLNAIIKGEVLSQQIESQSFIQERIQQLRTQIEQLNNFIERLKSQ